MILYIHRDSNQSAHQHSPNSLRCPYADTLHSSPSKMRPVKIRVRLREYAGWSESSLCVYSRRYVFWRCGSFVGNENPDLCALKRCLIRAYYVRWFCAVLFQLAFFLNLLRAVIRPTRFLPCRKRLDIKNRMQAGISAFGVLITAHYFRINGSWRIYVTE